MVFGGFAVVLNEKTTDQVLTLFGTSPLAENQSEASDKNKLAVVLVLIRLFVV
jgi:hypothetical protein